MHSAIDNEERRSEDLKFRAGAGAGAGTQNSFEGINNLRSVILGAEEHRPPAKMGDIDMEHDPDPIKASYDIYIKPRISSDKQIYVLQFPNRDSKQHYSAANQSQPFKMRIKPYAGMVEMDVPMDAMRNYDREKGIKWGEAMKKSNQTKNGGSHGMPGGFGIGGAQPSGRGRGRGQNAENELNQQKILEDYEYAVKTEQVLVKQTLGGQCISTEETTPQYMIGTFRKSRISLSSLSGYC